MNFSVLSYNTLFNNAIKKFDVILKKYNPDIICLQETLTEEENLKKVEKLGYKLADTDNSFVRFGRIYGIATFYKKESLKFSGSDVLDLNTNLTEYFFYLIRVILGYNQPKSVLKTDFYHKKYLKKFSVCNLHLYVIGSNESRINHINQALAAVDSKNNPSLIVCGDFNYFPYRRKKLEKNMKKFGLIEATKNFVQTMNFTGEGIIDKFSWIQRFVIPFFTRFIIKYVKTDYIFYRGLKLVKTIKIEEGRNSDHYPIYSVFSFKK